MTVMRVMLFVLDVSMLRECDGDGNAGVGLEYVGGTRDSGIVSSAADVLEMGGVGRVYEMCMCFTRGGVGGSE